MIIVKAWSIWLGRKRANNVLPEMNDNKGTSLSLANLDKGRKVFADISERLIFREMDLNSAIQYNSPMLTSVKSRQSGTRLWRRCGRSRSTRR